MKSRFLLLLILILSTMLVSGCDQSQSTNQIASTNAISPILMWLLTILFFLVVVTIFVLPLTHSSWGEIVAVIVTVLLLLFYYTQPIAAWLSDSELGMSIEIAGNGIPGSLLRTGRALGNLLFDAQRFVLTHLPERTILIGRVTILRLETNSLFEPTRWPLFILFIGGLIRIAVARYVKNERLRHVTGEYWLYILTYLVLAYIVSAITSWSFLALVAAFALIVIALALGLLKVLGDVLSAIKHILGDLWRIVRIVAKFVVYLVTIITEFVKQFGRRVQELYQKFIVEPILRVQTAIVKYLSRIERWLDDRLNRNPK